MKCAWSQDCSAWPNSAFASCLFFGSGLGVRLAALVAGASRRRAAWGHQMTNSGTLSRDKPAGLGDRSPMADPPVAAPAGVAVSGQDVLLATKLHMPRPQPGFVLRRRLAEALGEGLARGRMLVCAPAGFGKTALLADWACGDGRPVAWLGLDDGDSDPARFWRYVVAALEGARPGLTRRVGPPPRSFEGLVTALINELAADPGSDEVLLVLDDYHLVDSEPVHESVAFLLENPPPGLRVVISGRLTRRCRWRGCGPAASWPSCAPPTCVSPVRRRRRCWVRRRGRACPRRRWRRWWPARRGGRRGCSWPGCRCAGTRMRPGSQPRSAAATASCWTTWPMRFLTARPGRCARSCWKPRCWSICRESCVMRSPAGLAARRRCRTSSGLACSWCRWMRRAAGGATTTCSPTCCAPGCRPSSPAGFGRCTPPRPPGARSTA